MRRSCRVTNRSHELCVIDERVLARHEPDAVDTGQRLLVRQLGLARRLGELPADTDIGQAVYELDAVLLKANHDRQLLASGDALDRARRAVTRILASREAFGR